jgi:tRNA-2-methylthio-N6-dimethylallyladenosine synthase
MNAHDSERMGSVLTNAGGVSVERLEDADVVVFNTCSVREKAEQKLRSEVGKLAPLKRDRPGLVVAVAGCLAQQEGDALLKKVKHLDLVVGPDNVPELPALLMEQMGGAPPVVRTEFDTLAPRFLTWTPPAGPAGDPRGPAIALVTTMKGCDERCSFCVVPYTRGPERYRSTADVLEEIRRFVDGGSREVLLLGQTVDSFRDPELPPPEVDAPELAGDRPEDQTQFPHLLRAIAREIRPYDARAPTASGLARLRYTSPHPRHATSALARAHADLDVLARHVHLPVQSGSDRVLKRMIRRYTRSEYVARAERLKRARPGLTLSTDIIVGFPGETEEDFAATLSLVREVGFVSLFGFKYSSRPHTPAARLRDDVPEAVKSERLARLLETADDLTEAHLSSLVGTRQCVLVEGPSKSEKHTQPMARVQGRTERNEIVHIQASDPERLVGQLIDVEIVRANKHSLSGVLWGGVRQPDTARTTVRLPVWPSPDA